MTRAPAGAASPSGLSPRGGPVAWAAMLLVAGIYLAWAGTATWELVEHWGTPSCSWPVTLRGTATPAQSGLVRCYLQALAGRNTAGLQAVAAEIPPVRITGSDLEYSADARAGPATATLAVNPNDDFFYEVTITYANGVTEDTSMINMIAMGDSSGWRMTIGTVIDQGAGPPTAGPGPSP